MFKQFLKKKVKCFHYNSTTAAKVTGYSTCIDLEYATKSCIVYFGSIVILVVEDLIMVTIKTLGENWENPAVKVSRILLFWTEFE